MTKRSNNLTISDLDEGDKASQEIVTLTKVEGGLRSWDSEVDQK